MKENSIIIEEEISFFEDRQFKGGEGQKNQKDLTKSSSNPEKVYEILNSEIKKVTEQKSLDLNASNKTVDQPCNEQLLSSDIWIDKNQKQDQLQYYKKYELLKRQSIQNKAKEQIQKISSKHKVLIPFLKPIKKQTSNELEDSLESDDNEINEESPVVNKVNTIEIKSNAMNSTHHNALSHENINPTRQLCMTESDECFYPRNFFCLESPTVQQNITPQQMRIMDTNLNYFPQQRNLMNQFSFNNSNFNNTSSSGHQSFPSGSLNMQASFLSTQYSSNKIHLSNDMSLDCNEEENEKHDQVRSSAINTYYRDCMRIPTNESNESSKSSRYQRTFQNAHINRGSMEELNENKIYSSTFNEFYNAFTLNSYKKNTPQIMKGKQETKNEKQLINLNDIAEGKDTRTTLMIRNIPIKYTEEMLIKELEKFEKKFDCLYMPYDSETGGNKGYAFINFIHPLHILLFYEYFERTTWSYFESKKICELNLANFQGINEIKKHARNYKGLKKPTFFIITDDLKNNIEVPQKYLSKLIQKYPKMSYIEKKQSKTFLIKSFN